MRLERLTRAKPHNLSTSESSRVRRRVGGTAARKVSRTCPRCVRLSSTPQRDSSLPQEPAWDAINSGSAERSQPARRPGGVYYRAREARDPSWCTRFKLVVRTTLDGPEAQEGEQLLRDRIMA